MPVPPNIESCATALNRHCDGELAAGSEELSELARDFGGIVRRTPALVFRPNTVDAVAQALLIARDCGVSVTARGAGHSQSGQCVGEGIILDMRRLNRVLGVSDSEGLVEAEGGTTWRTVVDAAFTVGRIPCGLTHVVDTTIAGTLSVAGVGSETWRVGPQVDNVLYLDVATLDGTILRASAGENGELFDGVRAGLGQLGVIVRVGYPIRRCEPRLRSRYFVYRASERFLRAVEIVCAGDAVSFVSGAFARDARNPKRWVLLLVLGIESSDGNPSANETLERELDFDEELPHQDVPLWNASGLPGHLFFRVYAPAPGSLEANPTTLRPWVDHVFDRKSARMMLDELLANHWPLLSFGTAAVIFIRRGTEAAPLFCVPEGELTWGIGIFPSVSPPTRSAVVELMRSYSRRGCDAGGKRYLSGFVDFEDARAWRDHYGEAWPAYLNAKRRFDPTNLLNPGFIHWD